MNCQLRRVAAAAVTAGGFAFGLAPGIANSRASSAVAVAAQGAGTPLNALTPCSYLSPSRVRDLFGLARYHLNLNWSGHGHPGVCNYKAGKEVVGFRIVSPGYGASSGLPSAQATYDSEYRLASTLVSKEHKGQLRRLTGLGRQAFYWIDHVGYYHVTDMELWWMAGPNEAAFIGGNPPLSVPTAAREYIAIARQIQAPIAAS